MGRPPWRLAPCVSSDGTAVDAGVRAVGFSKAMASADGQLPLPLEYVPAMLRDHGYRDAHTYPLVSPDVGKVRRSYRRPPSVAWNFPRLELRTGNTYPGITIDCDGRVSVNRVVEYILDEGRPDAERGRPSQGQRQRAHTFFSGDPCALRFRNRLWIGPHYRGVLTLNPCWAGSEFETYWMRCWPWELRELRKFIPEGWKRPRVATTGIGRNVDLFLWAEGGASTASGRDAASGVWALPVSEVWSIARSSARYCRLLGQPRSRYRA